MEKRVTGARNNAKAKGDCHCCTKPRAVRGSSPNRSRDKAKKESSESSTESSDVAAFPQRLEVLSEEGPLASSEEESSESIRSDHQIPIRVQSESHQPRASDGLSDFDQSLIGFQ